MMKILYLVHQFFPKYYTGTERFTFELASQMQRMGHCPIVVTYDSDGVKDFEKLTDSMSINRYSYRGIPVIALKHTGPADPFGIFHSSVEEAARKLALKCDIVHVCHPMWVSSLAATYKKYSVPMVMTLTDAWLLCPSLLLDRGLRLCNGPLANGGCTSCNVGANMKSRLKEAKVLYDMADEITTASRFLQTLYRKNGWDRRIGTVPHSINFENIKRIENPKRDEVTFAFIGTIAWHKGVHVLIKAARQVTNRNLKVKIYGSTREQLDYSQALLDLAQGDDRILFLDHFEIEKLPEIMRDVSAIVIPSAYYENYPLVMLIALAYKVPPIVSNIGGMPEVVKNGFNGFVFEMGNHAELASIMQRIVEKPQILDELRANIMAPRRTEQEALDYENIYRKLVKDNLSG